MGCSCGWLAPGCLIEFWWLWRADTHCAVLFLQMRPLKQGCKVSQSEHYSAEVSLPKNWVNEKPKSLIGLNTPSYAAVLPSLPLTIYCAFIFSFFNPSSLCFTSPDNYASSADERDACLQSALALAQVLRMRVCQEGLVRWLHRSVGGEGFTVDQINNAIEQELKSSLRLNL